MPGNRPRRRVIARKGDKEIKGEPLVSSDAKKQVLVN